MKTENYMRKNMVYLRILEETDLNTTTKWLNDPIISDVMGYLPVFSMQSQLEYFK